MNLCIVIQHHCIVKNDTIVLQYVLKYLLQYSWTIYCLILKTKLLPAHHAAVLILIGSVREIVE